MSAVFVAKAWVLGMLQCCKIELLSNSKTSCRRREGHRPCVYVVVIVTFRRQRGCER